jgi:hypothetical protein
VVDADDADDTAGELSVNIKGVGHGPPPYSPSALLAGIRSIDENIANLEQAIREQKVRRAEYEGFIKAHEDYEREQK